MTKLFIKNFDTSNVNDRWEKLYTSYYLQGLCVNIYRNLDTIMDTLLVVIIPV